MAPLHVGTLTGNFVFLKFVEGVADPKAFLTERSDGAAGGIDVSANIRSLEDTSRISRGGNIAFATMREKR